MEGWGNPVIVDSCNQACVAEVRKGGGKGLLVFSRVHYHPASPLSNSFDAG